VLLEFRDYTQYLTWGEASASTEASFTSDMLPLYLGDVASDVFMHLVIGSHQIRHERLMLLKCGKQPSLLFLKFLGDIFGFGNLNIHCMSPSSNHKLKFIAEVVLDFVGVLYCQLPLMLQAILLSLQTLLLYHQCAHIFP